MVVTWSHNTHKLILRNLKKDFGRYFLKGDDFRQNKEFFKSCLETFLHLWTNTKHVEVL